MKMILLLLGWNLSLLGVVTILLEYVTGATIIPGIVIALLGICISYALRKTCPNVHSDTPEPPDPKRPLDFY